MIGTQVGQYTIVRELGGGSMGMVYEAQHMQLGGRAAIKILRSELASSSETLQRFFNEARAVNRIDHPGLVRIFDFGSLPNGSPYLVMELLRGETLASRLQARSLLTEPEALAIIEQLASILESAHERDIVHRDVKPSNIMLVPDPAAANGERVKLLDFGVAKVSSGSLAGGIAATHAGQAIGTPLYMSPEQCEGLPTIDGKADVYALGVILFELLTGRPPFEAENPLVVLNMHIRREPPALRSINESLSEHTSRLVEAMLGKNKESRPSASQLRAACRESIGLPAAGRPAHRAYRTFQLGVLGLVLLGGALVFGGHRLVTPPARPMDALPPIPDMHIAVPNDLAGTAERKDAAPPEPDNGATLRSLGTATAKDKTERNATPKKNLAPANIPTGEGRSSGPNSNNSDKLKSRPNPAIKKPFVAY